LLFCLCAGPAAARMGMRAKMTTKMTANPIRRVVNMLQAMQAKIVAEGKEEEELFHKFMCYCKTGVAKVQSGVEEATARIPQLESDIQKSRAEKSQLVSDITQAKAERALAEKSVNEASALRKKEAAAYDKESADAKANMEVFEKAITALNSGLSGSFLQSAQAGKLKKLVRSADDLAEGDRDTVLSFLSSEEDSDSVAPGTAEIFGIMQQMLASAKEALKDSTKQENAAVTDFHALIKAKTSEVKALTKTAETKRSRLGEVGIQLVNMVDDLEESQKGLAEDTHFLQDMGKSCKTKEDDWETRSKLRSKELVSIADTIKILNQDDALDLFKKTLPSTSLLQLQVTSKDVMKRTRHVLKAARRKDFRLDLISMATRGKKANFNKVLGMIDGMVKLLEKEQADDASKKTYCENELDSAEDDKKSLARSKGQFDTAISEGKNAADALIDEIEALDASIKDLDWKVAEATQLRKRENADYKKEMASNSAAKKLLVMAKERMSKFYDSGAAAPSFVQVSLAHRRGAPAPPPETFGAYSKKGGEHLGVVSMMELLIKGLDKEITEAEVEEQGSQKDYEQFVTESAVKRATDTQALESKEAAKAEGEELLIKNKAERKSTLRQMYANAKYIGNLHGECDWLLTNFDVRKKGRDEEIDSLKNAQDVLSGADYSLVQIGHTRLRRRTLRA